MARRFGIFQEEQIKHRGASAEPTDMDKPKVTGGDLTGITGGGELPTHDEDNVALSAKERYTPKPDPVQVANKDAAPGEIPVGKAPRKPAQATPETNSILEKKANARKVASRVSGELEASKSRGLQENVKAPEEKGAISADKAWSQLMALHGALRTHIDGLDATLDRRAGAYRSAANAVAEHDPSHPAVRNLNERADFLEKSKGVSVLRENKDINNNLVEAKSLLRSMKESNPATGELSTKFKTNMGELHPVLQKVSSILSNVHDKINKGGLSEYGIGSPVHDVEVKPLGKRINKLQTPKTALKTSDLNDYSNRHLDEERAIYHDKDKNGNPIERDAQGNLPVANPEEAYAPAGHVWGPTGDDGKRTPIKATKENLEVLRTKFGKQSSSVSAMSSMLSRMASGGKKVSIKRSEVGLPLEQRAEGKKAAAAGPSASLPEGTVAVASGKGKMSGRGKNRSIDVPVVPTEITDKIKGNRAAAKERAKNPVRTGKQPVAERLLPGAMDKLIDQAAEHVGAGRRIPIELRRVIGAKGVVSATQRAAK